jgi:hypothetical protein
LIAPENFQTTSARIPRTITADRIKAFSFLELLFIAALLFRMIDA